MQRIEAKIRNSSLWAASADALGWISEMVDERGLRRRARSPFLSETVSWRRKVGGLAGVSIEFPPGTYSDDTQLRLAVGRALRSDGTFDVEAFAKIELPVWTTYALGAGRGTKAAAGNLIKRDVTWFSNFFSSKATSYVGAGGNGAAMRIQPHVWANANRLKGGRYLANVLRDSLVTHGHMVGVCGAIFHARCLAHVMTESSPAGPREWRQFVDELGDIEGLVRRDEQLSQFWLGAWEQISKVSLEGALAEVIEDARRYIESAETVGTGHDAYLRLLDAMECRGRFIGAGINTAIAAAYLAWANSNVKAAVLQACNALGSDTDTIGTMVGALSGALCLEVPDWELQDREYILSEARRMYLIASGQPSENFNYPDLTVWRAPRGQWDAVGVVGDKSAIRGLGFAELKGEAVASGSSSWQWVQLDFGQTILCKSQVGRTHRIQKNQLPGNSMEKSHFNDISGGSDKRAADSRSHSERRPQNSADLFNDLDSHLESEPEGSKRLTVDELTNRVIRSQFDSRVLGECFKMCAHGPDSIERSIAFASIVMKAIMARKKNDVNR